DLERGEGVGGVHGIGGRLGVRASGEQGGGQGEGGGVHAHVKVLRQVGVKRTTGKRNRRPAASELGNAGDGELELHLHFVGNHGCVGPLVLTDLEGQALDGEAAGGGGGRPALRQGDGHGHLLRLALDGQRAAHFVFARSRRTDAAGLEGSL